MRWVAQINRLTIRLVIEMNELKEQHKEKYQEFLSQLRKYAHRGNSKCDIDDCPQDCGVKHKLGLDTAVAWSLADGIEFLRDVRFIMKMVDVVHEATALHDEQYKKLHDILDQFDYFLFQILYGGFN